VTILSPALYLLFSRELAHVRSGAPPSALVVSAAVVVAAFPVYLYFNFSGYMDVVIGVARFLRLELPENFRQPFLAEGFIEFWNRWHITLSTWIKTYVYSPLLLSAMRRFPSPNAQAWLGVGCYFVAFFIIGVWHGRTSEFIFFGVLLGLGVSINKLYQIAMTKRLGRKRYVQLCATRLYAACSRALTFTWFAVASAWFWGTWGQLHALYATLRPAGALAAVALIYVSCGIVIEVLKVLTHSWLAWLERDWPAWNYVRLSWITALFVATLSVAVVLNAPAPHIVYKAF